MTNDTQQRVAQLVEAAWIGMSTLMDSCPGVFSESDVINASLNVARQGILVACADGCAATPELVEKNREAMRRMLQQFMFDTLGSTPQDANVQPSQSN